jgi:EpsI family protein
MKSQLRTLALAAGMLAAAAAAAHWTPRQLYAKDEKPAVSLEELFPKQFGEWKLDPALVQQVVNPAVAAQLSQYYSDVLSRTYVNAQGYRIMLSLAYGADQSRYMQVHKPEVCYTNQGFKISYSKPERVNIGYADVPLVRLQADQNGRQEPISYWIRTGDYLVAGWLQQNIARVKNGWIKGYVPDGLLVRASSIDNDKTQAYRIQDEFLKALAAASSPPAQAMLLGAPEAR